MHWLAKSELRQIIEALMHAQYVLFKKAVAEKLSFVDDVIIYQLEENPNHHML